MTRETPRTPDADPPGPRPAEVDDEVAPTDPAHRAALVVMVSAPVLLGAAVFAILKLMTG